MRFGVRQCGCLAVAASAACAPKEPVLVQPVGVTTVRAAVAPPEVPPRSPRPTSPGPCSRPLPEIVFADDTAVLTPAQTDEVAKLTACFTTGPLSEWGLVVVGHADVTGAFLPNLGLGLDRAKQVAAFLVANGMPRGRVRAASVGEVEDAVTRSGRYVELIPVAPAGWRR